MAQANLADLPVGKSARYRALAAEITAVNAGESFLIARYASAASLLHAAFPERFLWTGFYLVDPAKPRELVVGPYQGSLGCLRIPFGKGVCGAVALQQKPLIVPDVHAFPGHITCDGRSLSEIVMPVFDRDGALAGVLDIDSHLLDAFDAEDEAGLGPICADLLTAA